MQKIVVKAKNNKINVLTQDSVLIDVEEKAKLLLDGYEIFLSVKGKDDELRGLKKEIKKLRRALKELKRNGDPSYYDVRDRLNSLRKAKERIKSISDEEMGEIEVEILHDGQLKVIHNEENIEIDDDDRLYYDLPFSKDLTTLRVVIVPLSCFHFTDECD